MMKQKISDIRLPKLIEVEDAKPKGRPVNSKNTREDESSKKEEVNIMIHKLENMLKSKNKKGKLIQTLENQVGINEQLEPHVIEYGFIFYYLLVSNA